MEIHITIEGIKKWVTSFKVHQYVNWAAGEKLHKTLKNLMIVYNIGVGRSARLGGCDTSWAAANRRQ